jgi:DNA-binding protein H-NS
MSALPDLIAQRDALNKQIEEVNRAERAGAIAQAKAIIAEHGLKASDLFGSARVSSSESGATKRSGSNKGSTSGATSGSKVAPKYRDPVSGATWTGRGRSPTWLAGRNKNDFLIG